MRRIVYITGLLFIFVSPVLFSQSNKSGFEKNGKRSKRKTDNSDAMNKKGVTAAQKGDYKFAISNFKSVISVQDKKAAITYNNLAYTYLLSGKKKKAIVYYQKAIDRNPNLLAATANLGLLLFEVERYKESIVVGEKVIRRDPMNLEVRNWLPEAYRKAAQKRMDELEKLALEKENDELGKDGKSDPSARLRKKRPRSIVSYTYTWLSKYVKFDLADLLTNSTATKVISYGPPAPLSAPMQLYADIWASPSVELRFKLDVPDFSMMFPNMLTTEQNLEFIFHGKKLFFGVGMLFSQANFTEDTLNGTVYIHNSAYPKRQDTKLGLVFGSRSEFRSFYIAMYPRWMFEDNTEGPQSIEYDRAKFTVEYKLILPASETRIFFSSHMETSLRLDINEVFVTEYLTSPKGYRLGHYMGIYDFTLDFAFGKLQPKINKVPNVFGFSITERLYFYEVDERSSFAVFGNGQGYFGFDSVGLVSGNGFKSLYVTSVIFTIYFKQLVMQKVQLKEEFGFESTSSVSLYNGLSFEISAGLSF